MQSLRKEKKKGGGGRVEEEKEVQCHSSKCFHDGSEFAIESFTMGQIGTDSGK